MSDKFILQYSGSVYFVIKMNISHEQGSKHANDASKKSQKSKDATEVFEETHQISSAVTGQDTSYGST